MSLWSEIQSQPEVLRHSDQWWDEVVDVAHWVGRHDFTHVVVAARGSSDNAARYAQYLWGARNRLHVGLAAPSLHTSYESPPDYTGSLIVGISQSGESPDLLAVMDSGRKQGRPTIAFTNDPASPMAQLADRHIDIAAGPERAVAATKTYTSQLFSIAALSAAMSGLPEGRDHLGEVSGVVSDVLASKDQIAHAAASMASADRCVVIGRGLNQSTAFEWALKIAELSYVVAQPFSAADFRHGPLALVEPGLVVLAVATDGPLLDDVAELLVTVRELGARVTVISDRPDCPADSLISLPANSDFWLSAIPATVAAQIHAYELTVARGLDPDSPRAIKKVTRTL